VVVYFYNPSTLEAKAGDCELEAGLGYTAKPCVKKKDRRKKKSDQSIGEWHEYM
jgi:hypothetical protein